MKFYLSAGLTLVVVTGACLKWMWNWIGRLERDSSSRSAGSLLQHPDSAEKVPAPSLFDDATRTLSIVVPAYNEEDRLPPTLEETMQYLRQRRDRKGALFTYEVIVVDDGSSDNTLRATFDFVRRFGFDAVRVLRLPANRGKGYAVKMGMLVARGESILFMDADGATRISDVEKLEVDLQRVVSGSKSGGLGLAVGSRAHLEKEAISKRHWYRNFLMHGFHLLVLFVAGGAVRDTQCGFKLFTRRAARLLYGNQRLQRWCFDVELLYLAQKLNIPAAEVAVNWTEIPGSKIKIWSIIHMSWELLAILIGYVGIRVWTIRNETQLEKSFS